MRVNVLTELRQPLGSVTTVEVDSRQASGRVDEIQGVCGTATLLRTDRGLLVDFKGSGLINVVCARCLRDARSEVPVAFIEEYVPVIDPAAGTRVRSGFEMDTFRIAPDYTLDLREGIRQYLLMSEGAKPLCRPDCAGLCVECGSDLNDGPCPCTGHVESEKPRP
jgi:uncharacterized protein